MARQRPNILWIVTTQWRARACGYAGDSNARTPNLDALSLSGANFEQAVTPHPFGPFARAALLTGVPSPVNGVRDYYDPLRAGTKTVAHELASGGYTTGFFGKWHLAPRDRSAALVGEAHAKTIVAPEYRGGFEFWEGFESGFVLNDPWLHGTRLPVPTQFRGYQSNLVCDRAAGWMFEQSARAERPWFCCVSLEPPHPPYDAPTANVASRAPESLTLDPNVPPAGDVAAKARRELAGYYAHIEATDRAIGRVLEAVDRATTAVVVTSVHGDMHGAHGLFRKGWPYEESVRVPLLVRLPPAMAREWTGRRRSLVSLIDVRDWTLQWAAGDVGEATASATQQLSMPSVVQLPHQCDRAWRAVRTPYRKLVVDDSRPGEAAAPWLYFDLERDPWERENLINDPSRQQEIETLRSLIKLPPP